ncbi:MAG: hypothetical protein SGPRY_014390, partial [Prymnesium sp.]
KRPMALELDKDAAAYAFSQLLAHLRMRSDVQNIDQMILAGFCRNCLSKWYHAGAIKAGHPMQYDDACELVYGMPYAEWKKSYQVKASEDQLRRFEETKQGHAKHPALQTPIPPTDPTKKSEETAALPTGPPLPPPAPPRLLSDVCCEPVALAPPKPLRCVPQPQKEVDVRLGVLTVSGVSARPFHPPLPLLLNPTASPLKTLTLRT